MRRMLGVGGVVGVLSVAAWAGEPKPPAPDPQKPVNYIAWINETFGGNVKNNAFDTYQAAYKFITPFEGEWGDTTDKPWTENAPVAEWLRRNQRGLEKFKEAAAQKECFFALIDPGPSQFGPREEHWLSPKVLMPPTEAHRDAVRGLLAEGFQAWAAGDRDKLAPNAVLALRSGCHLNTSPLTVVRLYGGATAASAYDALLAALDLSEDRDAFAAALLPKLEGLDPLAVPLSRVVLTERIAAWEPYQRRVPDAEQLQQANAYYDAVEEWLAVPYWRARPQEDRLTQMLEGAKGTANEILFCPLSRPRELDTRMLAVHRATHLILRLHVYHKENGKFPPSLDALEGGDIGPLRIDPFSGDPFVYQKRRASFKLYTVGVNLTDDGGQHDERWREKDYVFWPRKD
ncbi:MAG TPA: hypothetical protein PKK06_18380 [Phycisphaerae bacterium]|nr:hypothetical protein [Phycisphaerae bacterium]